MASSQVKGYKEVPTLALISKMVCWKVNSLPSSCSSILFWATQQGPSEQFKGHSGLRLYVTLFISEVNSDALTHIPRGLYSGKVLPEKLQVQQRFV